MTTESKAAKSTISISTLSQVAFAISSPDSQHRKMYSQGLEYPLTAAFRAFVSFLHAMIRRAGFIAAKCIAASKPSPVLAPVTSTDLPVRSALRTGGTREYCSERKDITVNLPIVS